jgi:molybdopterin-guanine dinucleotide biosynthesis protein A
MSPLYGLVVCGGKSSRMGQDKSLLDYHGKPQRYHLYEMLRPLCERVFISCNSSQKPAIPSEYDVLVDETEYADIGPMGALLTAFRHYPDAGFLVVGCDYPYIQSIHLQKLIEVSVQSIFATSYYNIEANIYEPLLSVYQSNIKSKLIENFRLNKYSLQSILKEVNADIIVPENSMIIKSIDTAEEYENVVKQLYNTENNNAF